MKTTLIMAITADGKIAKNENHIADWTSPEDKEFFVSKTKKAGCLIMGRKTYATIGRHLPKRLNMIMTRLPDKYENIPDTLEFTNDTPQQILSNLKERGFERAVICGGAKINTLFLKENLIDEIYLTIEPKIFGKGIGLFEEIDLDIDLELMSHEMINDNAILLKYKIKR